MILCNYSKSVITDILPPSSLFPTPPPPVEKTSEAQIQKVSDKSLDAPPRLCPAFTGLGNYCKGIKRRRLLLCNQGNRTAASRAVLLKWVDQLVLHNNPGFKSKHKQL